MAKEHELRMVLNAQMNSAYQSTFREAQSMLSSYKEEYNALANTLKDINAYERQAQAIKNTEEKLALLKSQYANIKEEYERTGSASSDLKNKMEAKEHQIKKTSDALEAQKAKLDGLDESLKNAGVDTTNLGQASEQLKSKMDEMRKSADDAQNSLDEMGATGKDALMDLEGVLVGAGLVKLAEELAEQLKACASASMEFEAGMAAVRRTVGGSEEEIAALGDEFQQMAAIMPITTSELADIATTAGQLGIAQEDVKDFTQVMAELSTTTDLSADSAATLLAQFSNITGTKDFDRLGSTVAALGDATATTASRVVEMSQGMAAAATVAGMTAQDVLGISAAVGALGGRTQTGATAMSQLITKLYLAIETGEGLDGYAKTANMTAQEFQQAWGRDAAGALNSFIQGLNDTERNGKSAIAVLNDLGITNARQLRVFTGLASSGDLLTRTINMANESWTENTALTEKASIMYDTNRAKMVTMQNEVNNLKIAVGDQFAPALGRLYEMLAGVAGGLADVAEDSPLLVKSLGALTASVVTLTASVGASTAALKTLDLMGIAVGGSAGGIMLAVSAVAALAVGLGVLAASAEDSYDGLSEVRGAVKDLADTMNDTQAAYEETAASSQAAAISAEYYINRLREMEEAGTVAHGGQEKYKAILEEINKLLPGVNAQLDEQTGLVMGGTDALLSQAEAWKKNAIEQAAMEANTERLKAYGEASVTLMEAEHNLTIAREEGERIASEIDAKENLRIGYMKNRNALTLENMGSIEALTEAQNYYDNEIRRVDDDLANLRQQQEQNRGEQDSLTLAVSEGEEKLAGYSREIDFAMDALMDFTDGNEKSAGSLGQMIQPMTEVIDNLDELAKSYEETYNAALESIAGQFDVFEEAEAAVTTSSADIIKALETQTEYWNTYSDNLADLNSRNISGVDQMVAALADGTKDGAATIASLAQLSDEDLQTVVQKWLELQNAQQETAKDLPAVRDELTKLYGGMYSDMKDAVDKMDMSGDAQSAALATIDAYISAVRGKTSAVYSAYAAIAAAGRAALSNGSGYVTENDRGYSTTTYYGAAGGTDSAPQGWRWVGEQGPELMYFQGGETVVPHTKSVEMIRDGGAQQTINVTLAPSYQITGSVDAAELREILEQHDRELPGKVTAILREAERDAVRRAYA